MRNVNFLLTTGIIFMLIACNSNKPTKRLPVLGVQTIEKKTVNGIEANDTIPHRIKPFSFLNQDSVIVTNETLDKSIYVADFFFTSCPSICPIMKKQLLRVYKKYKDNNLVSIVSHTIDPGHDDVLVLRDYAKRLEVRAPKWHFLTGDLFAIYNMAESSYMVYAEEDEAAPGGFAHSGALMLIDGERRVRGVYDGTEEEQVDLLLKDIDVLLKEYEKK